MIDVGAAWGAVGFFATGLFAISDSIIQRKNITQMRIYRKMGYNESDSITEVQGLPGFRMD